MNLPPGTDPRDPHFEPEETVLYWCEGCSIEWEGTPTDNTCPLCQSQMVPA